MSKSNTLKIIKNLKEENQDFEWYPTTDAMLNVIKKDADKILIDSYTNSNSLDVIDCGSGDGRSLDLLAGDHGNKYAIEKSKVLIDLMPADIFIVGTEFKESTLIDKKADVLFCNPPYSEYQEWAEKIIREANTRLVYLVIPTRWANSDVISASIEARDASFKILHTDTFEDAERSARATIDIVRIDLGYTSKYNSGVKTDPFLIWFNDTYKKPVAKSDESKAETLNDKIENHLVNGKNLIEALVSLYNNEMQTLNANFSAITSLDAALLKELDVNTVNITKAIKQRIEGLKNKYWTEFFNNYSTITEKLTTKSREKMLKILRSNMSVDFTALNAYAVTSWTIKNANNYFDSQLIDMVESMVNQASIKLYKSNLKTYGNNEWGYYQKPDCLDKYSLEKRLVLTNKGGLSGGYSWEYVKGLSKRSHEFIGDLITIANNLNYITDENAMDSFDEWESNVSQIVYCKDGSKLMDIKAFKNGNLHIKFNQKFIMKLNVEFGRLKGWLKDHAQASDELNIPIKEAMKYFNGNIKIDASNTKYLLLGKDIKEVEPEPETEIQIEIKAEKKPKPAPKNKAYNLDAIRQQFEKQLRI